LQTPEPPDASDVGITPKPWGIPAILVALALPVLLWASSLAIAIVQDGAQDVTDSEIVTGLILTIVLDLALIGLAAGLALQRYRLSWAQLGLRSTGRNIFADTAALVSVVLLPIGATVVAVRYVRTRRVDWVGLYNRWIAKNFWLNPIGVATIAHLGIIVYAVTLTAVGAGAAAPEQEIDELFQSRAVLPLVGVVTLLMAPLAEEIFFRGFIFPGLLRPLGLGGALAASGAVFGAFHITSLDTVGLIVPFGIVGALFAWLYYRSGSLWPSIAAHFVFNLVSFVLLASLTGSGS